MKLDGSGSTIILMTLTTLVGYLMVAAGLGKNALERRSRRRICPSCGIDTAACDCS
jgi:hypothetical protein